jgi:hypothetical protein
VIVGTEGLVGGWAARCWFEDGDAGFQVIFLIFLLLLVIQELGSLGKVLHRYILVTFLETVPSDLFAFPAGVVLDLLL